MRSCTVLLAIVCSWSFANEGFVRPEWQVTLADKLPFSPGLAVLAEDKLYFAEWTGNKRCLARNVYAIDLLDAERKPSRIAKLDCVEELHVNDRDLYVLHDQKVSWWQGDRFVPLEQAPIELQSDHRTRMKFISDYTEDETSPVPQGDEFRGGLWTFLDQAQASGKLYLDAYSDRALLPYPVETDGQMAEKLSRLFVTSDGEFLVVQAGGRVFPEWWIYHLKEEVPPERVGSQEPMGRVSEVGFDRMAFRQPQFTQAAPGGWLVYEASDNAKDSRGLFFVDIKKRSAARVWIARDRFLSGMSVAREGIVVSHPGLRRIEWYGADEDAFTIGKEVFDSDITRNEMISAEGENNE